MWLRIGICEVDVVADRYVRVDAVADRYVRVDGGGLWVW